MTGSHDSAAALGLRLREIADALGIPVADLCQDRASLPVADVQDLIRHYAAITDVAGRQRVMDLVRAEADRCRGGADRDARSR